jgi:hypothetical protein
MRKLLYTFSLLLSIAFSSSVQAQTQNCDRWFLDGNYQFLLPVSDFKDGGFSNGHGASMGVYYNLSPYATKVRTDIGFRINGIIADGYKEEVTLLEPAGAAANVKIYNTIFDLKLVGRMNFNPQAKLSFYLDGSAGMRINAGHKRYTLMQSVSGFDDTSSDQISSSVGPVLGLGGGLLYKISDRVDLDFRVSGDYAPSSQYIDMNSITNPSNFGFSNTDGLNLNFQIGFRVRMGCNDSNSDSYRSNRNNTRTKSSGKKLVPKKGNSSGTY